MSKLQLLNYNYRYMISTIGTHVEKNICQTILWDFEFVLEV